MNTLTFKQLRDANLKRCAESYHPLNAWSPTDWACATAGELGEACNLIKKLRRLDDLCGLGAELDRARLVHQIYDELADTIIYLDLLAARLGIDLDLAIRLKFDETSDKIGSDVLLSLENPTPPETT